MNRFLKKSFLHCTSLSLFATFSFCRAEEPDPTRFEKTTIATGLVQPMQMANAPDGHIFLIELAGNVKWIDPIAKSTKLARPETLAGPVLLAPIDRTIWSILLRVKSANHKTLRTRSITRSIILARKNFRRFSLRLSTIQQVNRKNSRWLEPAVGPHALDQSITLIAA